MKFMLERYNHHPRLMDEAGWEQLPESRWHPKIAYRYPVGSPIELRRRRDDFFYKGLARVRGNTEHIDLFYMQPLPELLDVVDDPIDIVGCALVDGQEQRTILLLEDHVTEYGFPYTFGKSTIVRNLVGLKPVDKLLRNILGMSADEKVSAWELFYRLVQSGEVMDYRERQAGLQMLTADVSYVARSPGGQLVVMAMVGAKEDQIWDTARSAMRYLVEKQDAVSTMVGKIELARRLVVDSNICAEVDRVYPIKEVVFLTADPSLSGDVEWGKSITNKDDVLNCLREQWLRNPIYLSRRTAYWAVDPLQHGETVERLLNGEFIELPTVRHLHVRDPKDVEVLDLAAKAIKQEII